jgi:Na+/H+ antiporter NhaD/arsenite permease-like protein
MIQFLSEHAGWSAAGVFAVAYVLFVALPTRRTLVAVAGAVLLVPLCVLSPRELLLAINWNVMGIFVGTLLVADVFMESRVPAFLAEVIVDHARSTRWAILLICALTAFISAFVENVATVLIVAPVALALARKIRLNPVKMMIAIAISSNLQGTATLIGDPPSMLLGGYAKMNFMDFFFYHGKPSIFFAVQCGALASFVVLFAIFRRQGGKVPIVPVEKVASWVPTWILVLLIVALAASSFFDSEFSYAAGIICLVAAGVCVVWWKCTQRGPMMPRIRALDWDTTLFLMGVFVIVGGISATGWIDTVAHALARMVGGNALLAFTAIVVISVALSAFIDNVPYLAAMLPVATKMAAGLGTDPSLILFGLLIGASLGGNITPIGASANIVACGLLKKEGHHVSFGEFARIGLPFTIAAVTAAYVFVWVVWGP